MQLHKRLQDALERSWSWEVGGQFGYYTVDQYDRREGGRGTYSSIDIASRLPTRSLADDIARGMNGAYTEGVRRGRAEILEALHQELATGDEVDIEKFINDFSEHIEI